MMGLAMDIITLRSTFESGEHRAGLVCAQGGAVRGGGLLNRGTPDAGARHGGSAAALRAAVE